VPPTASAGGGSRSPVWSTIRATVLGHAIELVATADTAFGASLLAAAGSVHPDLATASSAMVRPGRLVEPDPAESEALDARYAEWVGALEERGWLDRVPAAPG
jgi:sugar (pentulose or hexulose) kinase